MIKTRNILIISALLGALGYGIHKLNRVIEPYRVQSASEKFIGVSQAVDSFKKKYHHLPGDMNGDGKIGTKDISEWLYSFSDPRKDLETVTFWKDLKESGLYAPKKDAAYPDMPLIGTLLVASHSNGDNNAIKGNVLIWVDTRAVEYGHEEYPLTSAQAADIDRKVDDGAPATGFMRAYGKSCYLTINANLATEPSLYKYSANDTTKSCGVMYKISD